MHLWGLTIGDCRIPIRLRKEVARCENNFFRKVGDYGYVLWSARFLGPEHDTPLAARASAPVAANLSDAEPEKAILNLKSSRRIVSKGDSQRISRTVEV